MQLKVIILMLAGSALSLAAVYGTFVHVQSMTNEIERLRDEADRIQEVISIPVLARDIERGTLISRDDFSTLAITASVLPPTILSDLTALPGDLSDRYVAFRDIPANSIIFLTDLALASADGLEPDQASLDGRRFLLAPANLQILATQVAVNEQVDIYWTRETETSQLETRLLAVGIKVVELPSITTSEQSELIENRVKLPSADEVLLEGTTDDVARILQARASAPNSEFRLMPARDDVELTMQEVLISEDTLEQLPILRTSDSTVGEQLTDNVQKALNLSFAPKPSQPTTCKLSIVRSAMRSEVEVPC